MIRSSGRLAARAGLLGLLLACACDPIPEEPARNAADRAQALPAAPASAPAPGAEPVAGPRAGRAPARPAGPAGPPPEASPAQLALAAQQARLPAPAAPERGEVRECVERRLHGPGYDDLPSRDARRRLRRLQAQAECERLAAR